MNVRVKNDRPFLHFFPRYSGINGKPSLIFGKPQGNFNPSFAIGQN